MTLTLQALESAFANIETIGKGELAFPVAGVPVVLRIIPPDEETYVHKQAAKAAQPDTDDTTEEDGTQHRAMSYINEVKLGIVCHAIIEIDGLDLRDSPFIETGEKLPNGTPIKIARAEAIRKIIKQREWSGTLLIMMFRKYGELLERVEREAEGAVIFEPSDRKAEIERLEKRLAQLKELEKAEKEKNEGTVGTEFAQQVRSIVEIERQDAQQKQASLDRLTARNAQIPMEEPDDEPEPDEVDEQLLPPAARRPIIPQRATPPAPATAARPPMPPQPEPDRDHEGTPQSPLPEDTSFLDMSDPETAKQIVEAENHRLLMARMGAAPAPEPASESVLNMAQAARRPPHMDALEASRSFLGDQSSPSPAVGAPVLKAPAEELSRPRGASKAPPMTVNAAVKGQLNPRFKPSGSR